MRILVLGARSWIGYRLSEQSISNDWEFHGTSSSEVPWNFVQHVATNPDDFKSLILQIVPDVVVNLLRGEDENGFLCHEVSMDACLQVDAHYLYASSALALDGYGGQELVDSLTAKSISEYGIFKGRCEDAVLAMPRLRGLVLRFSSIHGWSPCRPSRTESLLDKVVAGESINVQAGVVQNRLSDLCLAKCIAKLISNRTVGVVHLGASDSSEEYDFLRRVAVAFGYSGDAIVKSGRRDVNLALTPTVPEVLGLPLSTEGETIEALLTMKELSRFKNVKD